MNIQGFLLYLLIKSAYALIVNDFIVDYFVQKQISSIVGYTCNPINDDLLLLKKFSGHGLTSTLFKLNNKTNIQKFRISQYSYNMSLHWKIGIFLDARCYTKELISSIFLDATNYRMYDELCDWLVLSYNLTKIANLVNDKAFGLSTNFVIAVFNDTKSCRLYDLYNLFKDRNTSLNVTYYGEWSADKGLLTNLTQPKFIRRANFNGLKLKILFYNTPYRPSSMPPAEYYQDYSSRTKDGRSKYGYNILRHLADMYNFSIQCLETEDWLKGDITGPMTRSLKNFSVDLTGTPIIMDYHKSLFMKFLHPGFPFRTCFFFRNPQPSKIESEQIFRPFDRRVWNLIWIFTVLSSLILSILLRYDFNDSLDMNISTSFVATIGAICQQATNIELRRYSTRIAFFSILVFSLLIYNYYSACVVSARLDEPIFKINDSLVELGKLNMKMASEMFTVFAYILQLEYWEYKIFTRKYWSKVPTSQQFLDPETGIRLVKKGGFAYNVHPEVGYDLIQRLFNNREICELTEVNFGLPTVTAFSVNKNCTFSEIIRVGLSRITEVGLRNRQLQRWLSTKPLCYKNSLDISSVHIYEFAAYLILLSIGFLASVLICFIENVIFQWKTESHRVVIV